ncbi:MAG TPA: helix-turn-helix domain-containing protein [Chitinophagales bacterium]|nr:helix-turn-helix domain-containing protein [Chitinophagales bacterium]
MVRNYWIMPGERDTIEINAQITGKIELAVIINAVTKNLGITQRELFGVRRTRRITSARRLCIYILRHFRKERLLAIAAMFDIDHTNVIYSCREFMNEMQQFPEVREKLRQILDGISPVYARNESQVFSKVCLHETTLVENRRKHVRGRKPKPGRKRKRPLNKIYKYGTAA